MPIAQTNLSVNQQDVAGATQAPDITGGLSEGIKTGMQLASVQDQMEAQKAKLEDMKLELQQKQFTTVTSSLQNLARANPKVAKLMAPRIRENMVKMGFDPNIVDYVTSDDQSRARFLNLTNAFSPDIMKNPAALASSLQAYSDVGELDKGLGELDAHQKNQQAIKLESMKNSTEIQKAQIMADASANRLTTRTVQQANREYDKVVKPYEDLIAKADSNQAIIDDVRAGTFHSNANVKADLEDTLSQLSSRKGAATVSGSERHALDTYYGQIKGLLGKIVGKPEDQIPDAIINELEKMTTGFKNIISKQHAVAFSSMAAGQNNPDVVDRLQNRFNTFRTGYGIKPQGQAASQPATNTAPPQDSALQAKIQKAKSLGYSDAEIQAYLSKGK